MFDVLMYLFENYAQPTACPDPRVLARKLSAAGFEQDDISEALEWLSGLEKLSPETIFVAPLQSASKASLRHYCQQELERLSAECRGFLYFLETAEAIDSVAREMIIERAMALRGLNVSLDKLKVIVLMVLWRREQMLELDVLLLEELLSASEYRPHAH